jgi:hypothetical protein
VTTACLFWAKRGHRATHVWNSSVGAQGHEEEDRVNNIDQREQEERPSYVPSKKMQDNDRYNQQLADCSEVCKQAVATKVYGQEPVRYPECADKYADEVYEKFQVGWYWCHAEVRLQPSEKKNKAQTNGKVENCRTEEQASVAAHCVPQNDIKKSL